MSETIIFLTKNDFTKLADFILVTFDATFIPGTDYENPESKKLKSIGEVMKHLAEYSYSNIPSLTYFITSPLWTIEPIYFDFIENENVGSHYSAIQRYGGPSIDFTPRMYGLSNSSENEIISGTISDYSFYISGSFLKDKINGYKTINRPKNLKDALSDIKKFIKKNGHKVVYRNTITKVAYAMTEAFTFYDKGLKLMQGDLTFERE